MTGQTGFDEGSSSIVANSDEMTRPGFGPPHSAGPSGRAVPAPRESAESAGEARLVINRGPVAGTSLAITAERMTFGRERASDIVLEDATVSRCHAELSRQDGRYVLADGGSLNGTYLNRQPVDRAELVDGDEIWIGKARFTFRLGA